MAKAGGKVPPKKTGRQNRKSRSEQSRPLLRATWVWFIRVGVLGLLVITGLFAWTDLKVKVEFSGKRWAVPARIYSRPIELYEGRVGSLDSLQSALSAVGYRRVNSPSRPGTFSVSENRLQINTRPFLYWDGHEPGRQISLTIYDDKIIRLRENGKLLPLARVEPALIARVYPHHREDRVLVRLSELPEALVGALVSMEDRNFYSHFGLSFRGIARAFLANVKAGSTVQGGSTLTQQLAKNYFLSRKRSLIRKIHEAFIALVLEVRYDKDEILEAYLNEIFLGQEGGRSIHGFGLASYFYFGRPISELNISESALLVGLARGASHYNPRRYPSRAVLRRNVVLDVMVSQGYLTSKEGEDAKKMPLGVLREVPEARTKHPGFVDLVRRQLRRDYHEDDLKSEGLHIFTTLDVGLQNSVARILSDQLTLLELEKGIQKKSLQGALVVTDSHTGEVLALVGDRVTRRAGFNRALDARRPIGSIVKPFVYYTALRPDGGHNLNTTLLDEPVSIVAKPGEIWTPQNYDRKSHGTVALYESLAFSYNQATVGLGVKIGVQPVVDILRRVGVTQHIPPYPSLFLGALSLSPLEVTNMYQVLASGGFETPLRAISEVMDSEGRPLRRYKIKVKPALDPNVVYLTTQALTNVVRFGTGRGANRYLGNVSVAGKTGTTDDLRDSWFAGYDAEHVVVTWVGKDDNSSIGLTGASGALRVWAHVMRKLGVVDLAGEPPPGVVWRWAKPRSRFITQAGCKSALRLPYLVVTLPKVEVCNTTHGMAYDSTVPESSDAETVGVTTRKE